MHEHELVKLDVNARGRNSGHPIQQPLIWYEILIIENNLFLQVFIETEQNWIEISPSAAGWTVTHISTVRAITSRIWADCLMVL